MKLPNAALAGCLALAASLPGTALAEETRAGDLAEKLNDPVTQYAVAGMLSAMSKAILDMQVAPFVKAAEEIGGRPVRQLPPDATVADVAGTSHEEVREHIVRDVPRAMSAMGTMATAVEEMLPRLEEMAERMKDALPQS